MTVIIKEVGNSRRNGKLAVNWEDLKYKAERAMKRQRKRALSDDPFFGVLGMKLQIVICTHHGNRPVETCATNGKCLFVNPEWFLGRPEDERYGVYLHEVFHVALMHHLRRGDRNFHWWNVAGDHAINLLLKDMRVTLTNALCDPKYKGWSAERIFRDVYPGEQVAPPPPPGKKKEEDGEDEGPYIDTEPCEPGDDEPADEPGDDEPAEDGESEDGEGGSNPPEPPDPGDGETREPDEGDAGSDDQPMPHGEVWDAENEDGSELSEEETEEAKREVAESLNEAREIARQAGRSGSAGFQKTMDEIIVPSPDWKTLFAEFWNADGDPVNETWSRFNRRMAAFDIWMPGMNKDGVDHIVIFDDRSGSVGLAESKAFYAHMQVLRDEVSVSKITLVPFNHVILQSEIVELGPEDELPTQVSSGGGTYFDACFNWLAREDEVPDKVIILTDLGDTVTVDEPECPVLWASVCPVFKYESGWTNRPPFGDVIEIEVV